VLSKLLKKMGIQFLGVLKTKKNDDDFGKDWSRMKCFVMMWWNKSKRECCSMKPVGLSNRIASETHRAGPRQNYLHSIQEPIRECQSHAVYKIEAPNDSRSERVDKQCLWRDWTLINSTRWTEGAASLFFV
jgi:hypothetical protein